MPALDSDKSVRCDSGRKRCGSKNGFHVANRRPNNPLLSAEVNAPLPSDETNVNRIAKTTAEINTDMRRAYHPKRDAPTLLRSQDHLSSKSGLRNANRTLGKTREGAE